MTLRIKRPLCHALLYLAALCATLTLPAVAATINVPADKAKIQDAIDAAANGDTVLVAPGTYYENIDFKGKAITVTSSAGPASTIIDGGSKPGVATVVFVTGETTSSVISKFTIRGGGDTIFAGASDGGIYVGNASATIENNTVTANTCHNIDVEFGTAIILNNEVSGVLQGNSQQESYCPFGSGVHLQGTPALNGLGTSVIGNTIENNLTGSGINIWAAQNVLIMNNIIRNNTSSDPGSALTSANSGGTALVQNLIYDNTSTCGGAIGFEDSGYAFLSILIANNTIVDNVTPKLMGASGCTPIAQIYPGPYSYGSGNSSEVIINNIISGSTSYPAVNCSWFDPPSEAIQPTFENNILYNGGGPFFGSYCVDVSGKYDNIVAQAQFVSPSTGDYHLKSTSPAIDKGQNSVVQTFLALTGQNFTTDFDGQPRLQDATGNGCTIDMGVYEYSGTTTDCSSATETLTSSLNPSSFGQNVTFTAQLSSTRGTPTGDVQFTDGTTLLETVAISSTGSASSSTSSLTVGSHTVTANYLPSGTLAAATATLTQVVNGIGINTNLTSSLNPANVGQTVTFTATLSSTANGTPTGTVTFSDGQNLLGTQTLLNGVASYTTSTLAAGTHTITVTYNPGASGFSPSSATVSQVIDGLPTTTSLTVAPTTAVYGSNIVMMAAVDFVGSERFGGGITFMDGAIGIATGQTLPGSSTLTFTDIYLTVGTHVITAVFSGDPTHNSSTSAPVTVTITSGPTSLLLVSTPNPAFALQPIALVASLDNLVATGVPGASISFLANGAPLGSAVTNAKGVASLVASLPAGSYSLTASFAGNAGLAAATSPAVAEIVNPNPTTTAVYAQPNPGYQGGKETLTASILAQFSSTAVTSAPTSGTVTLFDAGQAIATSPVDVAGQATFSTAAFTVGTHPITAVFNGNANFLTSTSKVYPLAILPRDFTLTTDPSITIQTQHHKELNLTLGSVGDFTDTIALSCSNLPTYASCTFPSKSPQLTAGSTQTIAVPIDTDALLNYLSVNEPRTPATEHTGVAFALLLPAPLVLLLRRRRKVRRALGLFAGLFVLAIAMSLNGCSSHYPGHTVPGTYSFTVTGEGATTHITHTATVTLIVTP